MSDHPSPSQSNPPIQKEHIVAYLEIMDCENKMQNPQDSDLLLAQLACIYNDVMKWPDKVNIDGDPIVKVKIFSNNILLSVEIIEGNKFPSYCYTVAKFCAAFQTMALPYGLFLHGAITVGKFAIVKLQPEEKDNQSFFVYGEALVRAYELMMTEPLPMVIFDDRVFEKAPYETLLGNEIFSKVCLHDVDGKVFINPFRTFDLLNKESNQRIPDLLQEITRMLFSEYTKYLENKEYSIRKCLFTIELFNRFCSERDKYKKSVIDYAILSNPWIDTNTLHENFRVIYNQRPPKDFNPPQQSEYIVAHLDFLGARKHMTSQSQSNAFLQKVNSIYYAAWRMQYELKKVGINGIDIKIFSDNIIIAKKTDNPKCSILEFIEVQAFCRLFQTYALIFGAIVRGAITQGKFFMDNTFAYGKALYKAYDLESKAAVYPRIIVDPVIFPGIKIDNLNLEGLKRDYDGLYFLDNFDFLEKHFSETERSVMIEKTRATIIAEYKKILNLQKLDLNAKYNWLANQFNEYCHNNNHPFSINLEGLTLGDNA